MERIGEKLRKRREELGFTIDDIARATNFRPELIRAVEGGRTSAFPAEAYLNAFLRAYATKLELDPREIILEQKSEEERINEALSGIKMKGRRVVPLPRYLMLAIIAIAAAILIFIIYDRLVRESRGDDSGDAGRARSEEVMTGTAGELPAEGLPQGPGPGTGAAGEARQDPEGNPATPEGSPAITGAEEREAGEGLDAATPKQVPDSLSISVSGWSTHVKLRSGGQVLLDEMLSPGYSRTFYSRQAFLFDHITNKDAVSLLFNGRPVRLPNSSGSKLVSDLRVPPEGR